MRMLRITFVGGAPIAAVLLAVLSAGCRTGGADRGAAAPGGGQTSPHIFVYAGTAGGDLQILELDDKAGDITVRGKAALGGPGGAVAAPPFGRFIAALNERNGTVTAFRVDAATGALSPTGHGGTGGPRPGRMILDRTGKYVLVTNQGNATVAVLPLRLDGRLGAADLFPAGAGAFGVVVHPSNKLAWVASPRAGTVSQYTFNEGTGTLTPRTGSTLGQPWGSGPRQVVCHPGGRFVFVLNEANDTISVHSFDDRMGTLSRMAFQVISTLPAEETAAGAKSVAARSRAVDLRVGLSGRFVYVLNRGHDSVATFAVDAESGGLTLVGHEPGGGSGAADLTIDPTGQFLLVANQGSKNVAVFRLDATSGRPAISGNARLASGPLSIAAIRPKVD